MYLAIHTIEFIISPRVFAALLVMLGSLAMVHVRAVNGDEHSAMKHGGIPQYSTDDNAKQSEATGEIIAAGSVASALGAAGELYDMRGEHARAGTLLVNCEVLRIRLLDSDDYSGIIQCFCRLGALRDELQDSAAADTCFERALAMACCGLGEPTRALCLSSIGKHYLHYDKLPQAGRALTEALELYQEIHGNLDNAESVRGLSDLGEYFRQCGQYSRAEAMYDSTVAMCRRIRGKIPAADFGNALEKDAEVHYTRGDYIAAAMLFRSAREVNDIPNAGPFNARLAGSLANSGNYYLKRGEYSKAKIFLDKALGTYRNIYGHGGDPGFARCLNYMAAYFRDRGDTANAAIYSIEALEMLRGLYQGDDNGDLAESLGALGIIRWERGDTTGARSFLIEQCAMLKRLHKGTPWFDLAAALSTLGGLYADCGDFVDAKVQLDNALEMYGELSNCADHPDLANCICNIAILNGRCGDFVKAAEGFDSALAMDRRLYNNADNFHLASSIYTIARTSEEFGDTVHAIAGYRDLLKLLPRITKQSSLFECEDEQLRFLTRITHATRALASFFLRRGDAENLYNTAIWSKGRILTAIEWRNRVLMEMGMKDSGTAALWQRYQDSRRFLSDTHPDADNTDIDQWRARRAPMIERLERTEDSLTRRSAALKTTRKRISWKSVRNRLHAHDAVVEFVRIPYYGPRAETDSVFYCALILRRKFTRPALIRLCEERDIKNILRYPVNDRREGDYNSYINNPSNNAHLYNLVWGTFDSLLHGARRVYIVPDGLLNQIAFGVLENSADTMLMTRYDLRYLFSSRDLVPQTPIPANGDEHPRSAAVFGGVRYNADSLALGRERARRGLARHDDSAGAATERMGGDMMREAGVGSPLARLNATAREAKSVAAMLARHGYGVTMYSGTGAMEEAFCGLQSPTVLHVATHGFFFSDSGLPRERIDRLQAAGGVDMVQYAQNPLLRSGLLLAGADRVWTHHPPAIGIADGIVTAYDIAQMDLSHTELVVLSACETGLGDIMAGEGVFGLKRAFRAAGAATVIMSLWKVPDVQTQELMNLFYHNWLDLNMDKPTALAEAQRTMAKDYSDPYKWAAFILVGN